MALQFTSGTAMLRLMSRWARLKASIYPRRGGVDYPSLPRSRDRGLVDGLMEEIARLDRTTEDHGVASKPANCESSRETGSCELNLSRRDDPFLWIESERDSSQRCSRASKLVPVERVPSIDAPRHESRGRGVHDGLRVGTQGSLDATSVDGRSIIKIHVGGGRHTSVSPAQVFAAHTTWEVGR